MTKNELENKLLTSINQFTVTNAEIAVIFPTTHEWFHGKIIADFDALVPLANSFGWNVKSSGSIDQTLKTLPDILFFRQ